MKSDLRLWCCPHFLPEVRALVAGSPDLAGLRVETFASSCLQGRRKGEKALSPPSNPKKGTVAVLGGGCLRGLGANPEWLKGAKVLAPRQCAHLLAPAAMVDKLILEGAYLLTPGWLASWREHIAEWGFDQATAREFFRESTQKLILLDTGVIEGSRAELAAMAEYLDLPWEIIPVGLDMLELYLERLVRDARRSGEAPPPPDTFFADHLMVIDLINELLTSGGEREAVERVKQLFGVLFAPGELVYTSVEDMPAEAASAEEDDFTWTESGHGFTVSLRHQEEYLGSLTLDDLTFAEYKERYLALALPLAKVCTLAICNAREFEARQRAEQAIRSMAGIVASSDDAIIGKTLEGIIVSWNKGASRIYGYGEEEVLGRHISFLTPTDQPDAMPHMLEMVGQGQSADQIETVWITKGGGLLDVSLQVSPVRDDYGRIVGASSIARDITREKQKVDQERRSLESQLMQAQKLESVGRLAGGVAHDFNNMLAVILGYSELALQELPPQDGMFQTMEQIQDAAERAKGLTRQLLAFARKQVLEMKNLDLNEVLSNFNKMIQRLIGEDIKIDMSLADQLPLIDADPAMMEQVLLNLAVNARDAMPDGGTMTIETREVSLDQGYATAKFEVTPGDYVMLAVTDTGLGMDEQTRQKIFEPFFTTKGAAEGTGLGLATVYGIVKQHGGNIWVYSEPGQGATFKVYFPVAQGEGALIEKPVDKTPLSMGGETILVVEDDAGLREFICLALTKLGYHVLCSSDPGEARALSDQYLRPIHLMLSDVVMPGMNGKDLYDSLAPARPEMKVIFMSGYTEDVIAHRGVLLEGINFIQKPFSLKQLAQKLGSVLAGEAEAG